jgi:hypothetical protein
MNCTITQSSITHKNTPELISEHIKNIFSVEQDNEINLLKDKLTVLDGAKGDLHKQMYYNYLYTMLYMILLMILISLLFTSYFSTSISNNSNSSNSSNINLKNSNILNSLNNLNK